MAAPGGAQSGNQVLGRPLFVIGFCTDVAYDSERNQTMNKAVAIRPDEEDWLTALLRAYHDQVLAQEIGRAHV